MTNLEFHRFECDCSSFHHSIRMVLDKEDGMIYFDISMNTYLPWYKRIWHSIKYIFNISGRYGHYDSTILKIEDYNRMKELIQKSEKILLQNT